MRARTAKFDLTLSVVDHATGLQCRLEFNADLLAPAVSHRLYQHLLILPAICFQAPQPPIQHINVLSAREKRRILHEWNATTTDYPRDQCIHQLFEQQVERSPEAVALRSGEGQLTYRELNERANQLAHHLRHRGVDCETPVAICVDRSPEMIVGLLAILKAGGAYVPLSPEYPLQRLAMMLADVEPHTLVTTQHHAHLFREFAGTRVLLDAIESELATLGVDNPNNRTTAESLAYIMYTSGSTGRPKGTSIVHRGVVRLVKNTNYLEVNQRDVFLQLAPLAFDASTFEIWAPLLNGAVLAIAPQGVPSLADIGDWIRKYRVTTLWLTAGLFHQMVEYQLDDLAGIRRLLAGGDVLSPGHVRRALAALAGCQVINGYGPTENTTFTCCCPMDDPEQVGHSVSLGRPISNTQVYVLDPAREPVPVGVPGELYIGGDGLAREYWRRPELTQEKFVHVPFLPAGSRRLYRSGDRVRWRADGSLEFLGRLDQQVKIRGYRIEPGEIECTLHQHPDVLTAVVQVDQRTSGEKRLVAFVQPRGGCVLTSSTVRDFLALRLPHYMLPAACQILSRLPLAENGKVDRHALAEMEPAPQTTPPIAPFTPPADPVEMRLCEMWRELLDVERVGTRDSFFDVGGDSLTALQLVSRIRDSFPAPVSIADVYRLGNIAGLARHIRSQQSPPAAGAPEVIARVSHDGPLPLSTAQQRLWLLHQLAPESQAYSIALAYRLRGALDASLLERCLAALTERQAVLRTTFHTQGGEACQRIAPTTVFQLERRDLGTVPAAARDQRLTDELTRAARQPLDLERGPLWRVWLFELGPDEHVLLVLVHHLVFDGWSEQVLFRELGQLYEGFGRNQPSPLPPLPLQFADFAAWQQHADPSRQDAARAYWQTQLAGAPGMPNLPTDQPRPSRPTSAGRTLFRTLPEPLRESLQQFSRQEQTTQFVTLLTVFQVLLYRYTAQDDLVVGTAVADRPRTELEGLIGFFANTVALRTRLAGNPTFRELVGRVQRVTVEAFAHQDLPFAQVMQLLPVERWPGQPASLPVMFVLHNASDAGLRLPGLDVTRVPVDPGTAKFDLTVIVVDDPAGMQFWIEYNTDLFAPATIQRLYQHLLSLLEQCLQNPQQPIQQLNLLSENDERLVQGPGSAISEDQRHLVANKKDDRNVAPRSEMEERIAAVWCRLLDVESVSVHDNFFHVGGHSLLMIQVAAELELALGEHVPLNTLFQFPTVAGQAASIERRRYRSDDEAKAEGSASLVTQRSGIGSALIVLPDHRGVGRLPQQLLAHLPADLHVVGVNVRYARAADAHTTLEQIAADCARAILRSQLPQPYHLIGYSFGGMLAYEVARQFTSRDIGVGLVGIIDTGPICPTSISLARCLADLGHFATNASRRVFSKIRAGGRRERVRHLLRRARFKAESLLHRDAIEYPLCNFIDNDRFRRSSADDQLIEVAHLRAFCNYIPGEFRNKITLFRAQQRPLFSHFTPDFGWGRFPVGAIDVRVVPGDHLSLMDEPNCQALARHISDSFAAAVKDGTLTSSRDVLSECGRVKTCDV